MAETTVYTALYDLNRGLYDGRSFELYKTWLEKTVALFPGIHIFHGGELDSFPIDNYHLINVPLNRLKTFNLLPRVTEVLNKFHPIAQDDITFQLPEYSLIQFAKFEFPEYLPGEWKSVMWVDAGISRFVTEFQMDRFIQNSDFLITHNIDAVFEVDVRNNLNIRNFALRDSQVGSCHKVVSGGAFWMSRSGSQKIRSEIDSLANEWLNQGIWDNEQVMLRNLLPDLDVATLFIPQVTGVPGAVARVLGASRVSQHRLGSKLIDLLLSRGRGKY